MPYEKEGDVLAVIHQANRVLSLHADPKLTDAAKLIGDEKRDEDPRSVPALERAAVEAFAAESSRREELGRACHRAALVGLTLRLKQHIKRAYGGDNWRRQTTAKEAAVIADQGLKFTLNFGPVKPTVQQR